MDISLNSSKQNTPQFETLLKDGNTEIEHIVDQAYDNDIIAGAAERTVN